MNASQTRRAKTNNTPTSKEERIRKFLSSQKTGVLATVSPDGTPDAAALYYRTDKTFVVRFMTKRFTRKSGNLAYNKQAVLVVFDEPSQTTVQIRGEVSEITDEDESHAVFMESLRASLHTADSAIPPVTKLAAGNYVAYQLQPTEIKMACYKRRSSEIQNKIFETIDKSVLQF